MTARSRQTELTISRRKMSGCYLPECPRTVGTPNLSTSTFDTLAAAQDLQAAGIGERQATAIVSAMRQATGEHLATKADLKYLATKADLYKLAIGIVLANVGLTAGVIRLLL